MKTLPTFRLVPTPVDEEARNMAPFRWAPDEIGKRHQIGGHPTFLQETEWPRCSACGLSMTFYGQLDSLNDDFVLADCGLIYIFVCFDDYVVQAILQSM